MAVPSSVKDREYDKFVENGGNTCLRIIATTTGNDSALLSSSIKDLEYGKFVEDINGDVAIVLLAV